MLRNQSFDVRAGGVFRRLHAEEKLKGTTIAAVDLRMPICVRLCMHSLDGHDYAALWQHALRRWVPRPAAVRTQGISRQVRPRELSLLLERKGVPWDGDDNQSHCHGEDEKGAAADDRRRHCATQQLIDGRHAGRSDKDGRSTGVVRSYYLKRGLGATERTLQLPLTNAGAKLHKRTNEVTL